MATPYMHKILMLIENCSAPTDTRIWSEATSLRDQGFRVSIVCPRGICYDQESHVCIEGIHIYRYRLPKTLNNYGGYFLEYTIAMFMTFMLSLIVWYRHGFDVIHATNPPDTFFILALCYRLLGKKFVFDQRDLAPEMFQVKFKGRLMVIRRVLLFLEWCSYHSATLVITSNGSQKRLGIERGRYPADRIFIVGNGPDLERLRWVEPEQDLKNGKRFLLAYIGQMEVQDGVEFALYALHELVYKRGRQDISLVLLGDGGQARQLQTLTRELGLESYTNFTGCVSSDVMVRYLSTADIGLTPDPKNGFNEYCTMVKTMEYMALGKPVVAFDLAETRLSVQEAALYATPNCVEDYASKIEMLLDHEELRSSMGAYARKRIEECISWEHDQKNLRLAYAKLFPNRT